MVSGPYGGSVLQEWYESVRMGDVMVVQLQIEGSLAGRKGSYGADIWRSDTVDLSHRTVMGSGRKPYIQSR